VLINTSTEISNNTFEALDLSNMVVLLSPIAEEPPIGMFDHQEIITVYYTPQRTSQRPPNSTEMTPLLLPSDQAAERRFYNQGNLSFSHANHGNMNMIIHKIARHIANLRLGLALGGMAARGLAHIGVLKVLERNAITIDMIAASNTGAIIGAMYALGISVADIEQAAFEVHKSLPLVSFRDFSLMSGGLLSQRRIMRLIAEYLPEKLTFHDLHIALRIITMTLDVGKEVPLASGSLLKAIEASIAMPGIFPPINYDGNFLVDGSTINPVPMSDLIEMEADILVGVNSFGQLSPSYPPPPENYVNLVGYAEKMKMIDIITRSFQNLQYEISSAKAMIADVTIIPDLLGYTWVDFKHARGIIEAGEKAAEQMLPELKKVIENRRLYRRI
jgi:NTE family protein